MAAPSSSPNAIVHRSLQPPQNRGMQVLDRNAFTLQIPVLAARVPANKIGDIRHNQFMTGQVVDIPKVKSVLHDTDDTRRRVLLRVAREDDLPSATRDYLSSIGGTLAPQVIELGYDHWTANEILNSVIPIADEHDVPASFTQTGHIAHLNLRDEWLPYKDIIGQVILDKLPGVRTVVNKLNTIHAQFRFFDMEVIAGDKDFVTSTSESGCNFVFDFSKVYWNSRLHTEHERLIKQFAVGSVVADAMAGVGPFAVPASKKGAYVLGNDLNPESVKWMRENRVKNHVENRLRVSERDAREFIRGAPLEMWTQPFPRSEPISNRQREKEERAMRQATAAAIKAAAAAGVEYVSPRQPTPAPQTIDHYVMNLPDSALEFLDAYAGSYVPLLSQPGFDRTKVTMPLIHVHCFTRELEFEAASRDICERAAGYLGHQVSPTMEGFFLHLVRRVAPNKDMYCLSFRLPEEVAYKV